VLYSDKKLKWREHTLVGLGYGRNQIDIVFRKNQKIVLLLSKAFQIIGTGFSNGGASACLKRPDVRISTEMMLTI